MKVLVVGSGGREHTIVWKIKKDNSDCEIYAAPGNGGMANIATCVPIGAMEIDKMIEFAKSEKIDLVMVAPDDPLAAGMVDAMQVAGIRAFGPTKDAAIIEASKSFSKELMKKYNIPTAAYDKFENSGDAIKYLDSQTFPVVIKADGLALGKGVIIAEDYDTAVKSIKEIMDDKIFGDSGNNIIIEEFLTGPEVTVLAFTDGKSMIPMVSSQDHKRAFDGNKGLNTGGMGTFTPSPVYTKEIADKCMEEIFLPTMNAMNKEGRTFKGIIYFGLMITNDGPKVIEYNARFGDPETQVILPVLKSNLLEIFEKTVDEELDTLEIEWDDSAAACIVMASGGYPSKYATGYEIEGLDSFFEEDAIVFHAGTKKEDGKYYTAGGRVLGVVSKGNTVADAAKKAYEYVSKIDFKDKHYRTDIGK